MSDKTVVPTADITTNAEKERLVGFITDILSAMEKHDCHLRAMVMHNNESAGYLTSNSYSVDFVINGGRRSYVEAGNVVVDLNAIRRTLTNLILVESTSEEMKYVL